MVANVQKSGLLAKISQRAKQVQADVAKTPINYGNPALPPGVTGVAQLDRAWLGEFKEGDNKGQVYFMAMGSVVHPSHHNEISIKGMKTQIGPIPLCDTPNASTKKDFKSHYNDMIDEICKLGDMKKESIDVDKLESILLTLSRLRPHFRFRTWQGKKQTTGQYAGREPQIRHEWHGRTDAPKESEDDGVNDEGSTQEASTNGETTQQLEDHSTNGQVHEAADGLDTPPTNVDFESHKEEATLSPEEELEQLIVQADDNDHENNEEARKAIQEMAMKNGVTEKEVEDAASFREVITFMNKRIEEKIKKEVESKSSKDTKKETKEKAPPKVGDTCKFQKNKQSKVADCVITYVNMTAGLVNLKDLATDSVHKGVKIENIKLD